MVRLPLCLLLFMRPLAHALSPLPLFFVDPFEKFFCSHIFQFNNTVPWLAVNARDKATASDHYRVLLANPDDADSEDDLPHDDPYYASKTGMRSIQLLPSIHTHTYPFNKVQNVQWCHDPVYACSFVKHGLILSLLL